MDLLPKSKADLDKLIEVLKENPEWLANLVLHTNCRGNDAYNMKLS